MRKEMKRAGAAALAEALILTGGISVSASEAGAGDTPAQQSSLNLTTSQEAHYSMTIPMQATGEASIPFGKVDTEIGDLTVTGDIGTKQQVSVTVEQTPFTDVKDAGNSFRFELLCKESMFEKEVWDWQEVRVETPVSYPLTVHIPSETWAKVVAGEYAATLTFKAELQNIE